MLVARPPGKYICLETNIAKIENTAAPKVLKTITPAGIELNPSTEHIEEPYSDKVKEILERKGVKYKKVETENL